MIASLDFMPQPFAWVDIPAGKVTLAKSGHILEPGQTFEVPAFVIAKYPLTNAQFAKFIEAEGYNQRRWWTDEGWQFRETELWTEPRHWQDSQSNKSDHPVVGVSWYEAMAFCLWLSDVTGEKIVLPTEQQWQRAAQGDTNRIYPWGDVFDKTRCNASGESTTPVTQYEGKGDSPFGVVDMSGNTWEWCLTAYKSNSDAPTGTEFRMLRGGTWTLSRSNFRSFFRADFRGVNNSVIRDKDRGFRLARV